MCYPARKRRVTRGRKSGGGIGRRTAASVLGRWSPVNVDYLGEQTAEATATAAEATSSAAWQEQVGNKDATETSPSMQIFELPQPS